VFLERFALVLHHLPLRDDVLNLPVAGAPYRFVFERPARHLPGVLIGFGVVGVRALPLVVRFAADPGSAGRARDGADFGVGPQEGPLLRVIE